MPDIFEDLNKIFKKDLLPNFLRYLKESDNAIPENINSFLDDPQIFIADLFEKFSKNKDNNINKGSYKDFESVTDINPVQQEEYDDLYKILSSIEDNMIHIEKVLKEKI